MMKKVLAVFLCLCIALSSLAVGVYALCNDEELNFVAASDIHYLKPRNEISGNIDDPIYWYSNNRGTLEDESGFLLDGFLKECAQNDDCDYVFIAGDLADNGRSNPEDHRFVAEKLKAFEEETGKKVYVINGNHDCSEKLSTTRAVFKEIYAEFGYNEALTVDENTCSYTADIGDKYRLIAFDTNHDSISSLNAMNTDRVNWVYKQSKKAKEDGKYPIVLMHHNLLDHISVHRIMEGELMVNPHNSVAELWAGSGIKLVISGHEHCSDTALYTSTRGKKIYDFAVASLSMYPLSYRQFSVSDKEIKYDTKNLKTIDTAALSASVGGYSEEQLRLMNEDLNEYANGFLRAGLKHRFENMMVPETIGIYSDNKYYDAVATAMISLENVLQMPLYGENSVQNLASQYKTQIPESSYDTAWEIIMELVADHFRGEESLDFNSTEMKILFNVGSVALKNVFSSVSDEYIFAAANEVLQKAGLGKIGAELVKLSVAAFGPVSPGEYLALAIAAPFIYEFVYDNSGINDSAGVIAGYGEDGVIQNAESLKEGVISFINKISVYVNLVLKYIFKAVSVIV